MGRGKPNFFSGWYATNRNRMVLQDKAMMGRWGLDGMQSFEQASVARKEGAALESQASRTVPKLQAELS